MLLMSDIYKSFPHTFEPVLKGINLEMDNGEFCVIVGSNGSGKSTLLRSITGEYEIDSGTIFIDQKNMTHSPLHKRAEFISSVTQDSAKGTIEEMTLLENITLSCLRGKSSSFSFYARETQDIIEAIKELDLGLEKYIQSPIGALSGGQRQVIATIMALFSKPKLLLLDEHTSALDPKIQHHLMEYTARKIKQNHITSIMITHNLADAVRYGDRLIMIHRGKVVLDIKDKSELNTQQLLALFHQYEDDILLENQEA